MDSACEEVLAVIPAYNEAANIAAVVAASQQYLPLLVVDDGSVDETTALAKNTGAQVLRQVPNQGKGAALKAGFRWAIGHEDTAALTLVADGQHDPHEIPRFLSAYRAQQADLADLHVMRGEAEDLARAQALYNLSSDLFKKMGAVAYTRVIESRLLDLQVATESQVVAAKKVSQDMVRAGLIQSSFLPEVVPQPAGWQLAVKLEPVLETSGDFYDFIPLPEDHLGIVIADVTDKGAGAALYMASCRTLIRTYAELYPSQPEQVLAAVNRRLLLDTHSGLYITVFYSVLDPARGRLIYCNAGHNPPYLFRAPVGETVQSLPSTGMAIGIMPEARWTQREIQLDQQDVLFLFTDGVTEALDEHQALFGEGRLLEAGRSSLAFSGQQVKTAQTVLASVLADIRRFVGSAPRSDDLTLMIIRRGD